MRNIKFRGKSNDEWVYGLLLKSDKDDKYKYLIQSDHEKCKCCGKELVKYFITNEKTIGQYTGLKDRNMKEIYEGDIVKFRFKEDREEFPDLIGYIEYQSTFAAFRIMSNQGSFKIDITEIKFIEKIGNIYDNPESLEKGE